MNKEYQKAARNGLTREARKEKIEDWMKEQPLPAFSALEIAKGQGMVKSTYFLAILSEMTAEETIICIKEDRSSSFKFWYQLS